LIYNFENYSIDVDRQELRRGHDRITIDPQVFDLLLYLIRNRDRVVTKDDLIQHVWNGRIVSRVDNVVNAIDGQKVRRLCPVRPWNRAGRGAKCDQVSAGLWWWGSLRQCIKRYERQGAQAARQR
jgi:hypothetical protein